MSQPFQQKTFALLFVPVTNEWICVLSRNYCLSSVIRYSESKGLRRVVPTECRRYYDGGTTSFMLGGTRVFIAHSGHHTVGDDMALDAMGWDSVPKEILNALKDEDI